MEECKQRQRVAEGDEVMTRNSTVTETSEVICMMMYNSLTAGLARALEKRKEGGEG